MAFPKRPIPSSENHPPRIDAAAQVPMPKQSSAELPDALRHDKADMAALGNAKELKSASASEGSGVAGKASPRARGG